MIYAIGLLLLLGVGIYGVLLGRALIDRPQILADRRWVLVVGVVFIFISADIGVTWSFSGMPTPQSAFRSVGTRAMAEITADLMRAKLDLPVQLNDELWLTDLQSKENILIYTMSVNVSHSEDYAHITGAMKDDLTKNACSKDEYKTMLKYGLAVQIDLRSPYGWNPVTILVTPQSCAA